MARSPARPAEDHTRSRDAAFVLPFFGVILLMPPFLNLFIRERLLWGIPLEVLYLFGIWFALVAGALILTRRLPRQHADAPDADTGDAPTHDPAALDRP